MMKKILSKDTRGFTLIELLIVIALLGALAVGLLATIDPFEQLKKGRDTSKRNTVEEFYNSNLRYYAIRSEFPWGTAATAFNLGSSGPGSEFTQSLMDLGELKSNFLQLGGNNLTGMYVNSTSADHVSVCFEPESKSFQGDPNTKFDQDGATLATGTCVSNNGTANCYWCIQ